VHSEKLFFRKRSKPPIRSRSKGIRRPSGGKRRCTKSVFGLMPQVLPVIAGQVLYFIESKHAARPPSSAIVGAGGIGPGNWPNRFRVLEWAEGLVPDPDDPDRGSPRSTGISGKLRFAIIGPRAGGMTRGWAKAHLRRGPTIRSSRLSEWWARFALPTLQIFWACQPFLDQKLGPVQRRSGARALVMSGLPAVSTSVASTTRDRDAPGREVEPRRASVGVRDCRGDPGSWCGDSRGCRSAASSFVIERNIGEDGPRLVPGSRAFGG